MLNGYVTPGWGAPDLRPYMCIDTASAQTYATPAFGLPLVGGNQAWRTLTGIAEIQARQYEARQALRGRRIGDSGRAELFGGLPHAPYNATPQIDAVGGWTGDAPIPHAAFDRRIPKLPGDRVWKPAAAVHGYNPRYHVHMDCPL